jgi:hypothetical protein
MTTAYTIVDTSPTIYQDAIKGVVNGVLVRFTMDAYNELHEVRVPELNAATVKTAIEKAVSQRDELAGVLPTVKNGK